MTRLTLILTLSLSQLAPLAMAEPSQDNLAAQLETIDVVIQRHCLQCHGPKEAKAELRLDKLDGDLVDGADAEMWHEVLNQVAAGDMPPEDAKPLSEKSRQQLARWIRDGLELAAAKRRSTAGQVVLRRLTRYEYQHTMEDLLGLSMDFSSDLPQEAISRSGFLNNGQTLLMSPVQMETYLQVARRALDISLQSVLPEKQLKFFVAARAERDAEFAARSKSPSNAKKQPKKPKKPSSKPAVPQGYRSKRSLKNTGGRDGRFVFPLSNEEFAKRKSEHSSFDPITIEPEYRQTYALDEWPTTGEILVRVKAAGQGGQPQMTVSMGFRASGAVLDIRPIGRQIVSGSPDEPQVFEFRTRMEAVPVFLTGKDKFRGELVAITNDSISSELLLDSVEVIYPAPPQSSQHPVLPPRRDNTTDREFVEATLRHFVPRAYRRPVSDDEIEQLLQLHDVLRERSPDAKTALRDTLAVVLTSPHFLYLTEPRAEDTGRQLNDDELASRLSYFLWSTMPDETLRQLADDGRLREPKVLRKQVQRLLTDKRSERFVRQFVYQWLDLNGLQRVAVNPEHFPQYDDDLKRDSAEETYAFFRHVLRNDLSALSFLDSDFLMLNDRMAKHYGLADVKGSQFRAVPIEVDTGRGGLLTQASVLTANSTGVESHPIKRGVWLLRQLLNDPPPPPPPNVPALEEDQLAKGLTVAQLLKEHRNNPACYDCHNKIDPWGLTFENYNAVGQLRGSIQPRRGRRRVPVETSSQELDVTLPDGAKVASVKDVQRHLVEERAGDFSRAMTENLLIYALGRELEFTDAVAVDQLTNAFAKDGYRLRPMIERIVLHEVFQQK